MLPNSLPQHVMLGNDFVNISSNLLRISMCKYEIHRHRASGEFVLFGWRHFMYLTGLVGLDFADIDFTMTRLEQTSVLVLELNDFTCL